jgi:putative DNA primase/helicase
MIAVANLPQEIRESRRAVVWKYELRDGRRTKVPYIATRPWVRAGVDRPETWGTFAEALTTARRGAADGVGIVLGDGLVGVDLDHCCADVDGMLSPEAQTIVGTLWSYTERSPSGHGVHILAQGALPPGRRRAGFVEMYDRDRFFTVTGRHLTGTPTTIEERTAALATLHRRIFGAPSAQGAAHRPAPGTGKGPALADAALLAHAHAARNGAKFSQLWSGDTSGYPSHSEADLALCTLLAFWTDGDAARIDALFRQSGLMREKWDTQRGTATYGEVTLAAAVGGRR